MPIRQIHIEQFLELRRQIPVFDVRSPAEYSHAHIPKSFNLPIFNDEERAVVGTLYKQKSRTLAVEKGLEYFAPKMKQYVKHLKDFTNGSKSVEPGLENSILIHCWRGGMRSGAMAWLFDLYGYDVYTLIGGYKAFRKWTLDFFEKDLDLVVIGGYTGSEKTRIIKHISQNTGIRVLDLESLASHRGSAFGSLGREKQPSQEMFENLLATNLDFLLRDSKFKSTEKKGGDCIKAILLEDESQRIGKVCIPASFWKNMRDSNVLFLVRPFERRLENIVCEYGSFDRNDLEQSIERISKRLGGLETKTSKDLLSKGDIGGCFGILLQYYDKTYSKSLYNRKDPDRQIKRLNFTGEGYREISEVIVETLSNVMNG